MLDPDRIDYLRAVAARQKRHAQKVVLTVEELCELDRAAIPPQNRADVLVDPDKLIADLDAYRPRVKVPARTA